MVYRFLLWALLLLLIFRAIGRVLRGIAEGAAGPAPRETNPGNRATAPTPARGEMMARDPVCGTYVVPGRALSARGATGTVYFCSEKCRQAFLAH
jgi:YHS domain-containing protein